MLAAHWRTCFKGLSCCGFHFLHDLRDPFGEGPCRLFDLVEIPEGDSVATRSAIPERYVLVRLERMRSSHARYVVTLSKTLLMIYSDLVISNDFGNAKSSTLTDNTALAHRIHGTRK